MRRIPEAGVVAASGGSHDVAVAYAARQLGVRAKIFVPTVTSPAKIDRIRQYGADLIIEGELYADALAASKAWMTSTGALPVHAYDQVETLLGQGTIGRELAAQAPAIDTLLVPVGGGGLIGGVAAWYAGSVRTIGVEPQAAPTLTAALKAGRPIDAEAGGVAAESLAPRRVGELMLPIAQSYVDRVVLVSDADIRRAQAALWELIRVVAEAGWGSRAGWSSQRALRSSRRGASVHPHQRWQYDGRRLRAVTTGGPVVAAACGFHLRYPSYRVSGLVR